jgi:hypothetical protein
VFLLAAVFCLSSSQVKAQSSYGGITGTVTDASGAIVPNATVIATNTGTNEKHQAETSNSGDYRIVSLVPAIYKVEVGAPNFKKFVQTTLTVQVGTTTTLNVILQIGAASETVEVTTEAPLLQTESGAVGSQVEGKVVQEMPLNGRNVMNLLALVPGVVPQQSTSGAPAGNAALTGPFHTYVNGWGNYSIGGGIANESAQYIDGAGNNMLGGNSPALVMTQDMVQEFKVESGAVSAEYGHFGGGVINMTSKSGTNQFHGALYEYVRNTILNANDFTTNNTNAQRKASNIPLLPKSPFHQNQYGATIGGPIKKDKAFFMFSWENYSMHKSQGATFYVPTKAMRGEDSTYPNYAIVSKALPDGRCAGVVQGTGSNGVPVGSAGIPLSCISKVANVMKGFFAYPNQAADGQGKNFADQPQAGDDAYQYNVRFDQNLGSRQQIFGRYTKWHMQDIGENDFGGKPGNNIPADFGATANQSNNVVLGDTITINPTTIADVRVAYMRDHFWNYGSAQSSFDVTKFGTAAWNKLGPQMSFKETPIFGLIGPLGFNGPWNIPVGANQIDTFEAFTLNYSVTKIFGKHTFKVGGESELRDHSGIGNYAWDGGQTMYFGFGPTDEWASFMLGDFGSDNFHTVKNSFSINKSNGVYAADTWKVNAKLTLNLGLRWDIPGGIYEKKDRITVFLPDTTDTNSGLPGTLALTNSPLYTPRTVSTVKYDLLGPRASLAYSLSSSLVLRGGYGLSAIPPDLPIGLMAFNSPVSGVDTLCQGNATNYWDSPCTDRNNTLIQPLGRSDLNPSHVFYNQMLQSPVPNKKYPYMQQWNVALSKTWKGDVLTELQYVGSKGSKLPSTGVGTGTGGSFTSIDQLDPKYYSMGHNALAATAPCAKLGGTVTSVGNCLQKFPQYSGVLDTGANNGSQTYEAISVVTSKRFRTGGVVNANYTYSHIIGDTDQPGFGGGGNWQNFANPAGEKSIGSYDVKNRAIINYVLDLPFGKGHKWMNQGGVSNAILGGWQVNGITTLQSGFPYSFSNTGADSMLFQSGQNFSNVWGAGSARPDFLGGCNLNNNLSYLEKYHQNAFFNKACAVPAGTSVAGATQTDLQKLMFGNAPRNTDAIRSQFVNNFDFTVGKNVAFRERYKVAFKAEFFNIFNHPVFGNATADIGNGSYGQASPNNQQRLMQLSLRLSY